MRMFRPRARKPASERLVIDSLPMGLLLLNTQGRVFYGVILGPVACIGIWQVGAVTIIAKCAIDH